MKCKDCTDYICNHRTSDAEKDCFFEKQMVLETNKLILDFIAWEKFRREAAKDILCTMISSTTYCFAELTIDSHTDRAIRFADNLISKLKEKEEK